MNPSAKLSVCMIVRDEEATLDRALASVAGVADEIVVVDTGSVDGTAAIAKRHGAKVVEAAWQDDFSRARNVYLEEATGDWVMGLDGDEWLDDSCRALVKDRIATATADGLQVVQRSFLPVTELITYEECPMTRVFRRRPEYRYEGAVHEQIVPAILRAKGTIAESDLVILHDGYAFDGEVAARRSARNLAILERLVAADPADSYLLFQLGVTRKAVGDVAGAEAALGSALDGDDGRLGEYNVEQACLKLAQIALGKGDHKSAITFAEQCLARNEHNALALYVGGLALIDEGDFAGALRCFTRLRASPIVRDSHRADVESVTTFLRNKLKGR